jgi:diacylglycerol kinase family enzyme
MKRAIALIGNPIAGGGALKEIKKAEGILKDRGLDVRLMLTSKKGDAESFAKSISELQTPDSEILIISAGGDGTCNEVANGLIHSDIPMAILPLGTTSVLAKELNIPANTKKALNIALNGKIETAHLGRITLRGGMRHFLLMAGVGFDGEAVFGVNENIKKYSGKGAYILSGIKVLLKYNPEPITINAQINQIEDIQSSKFIVQNYSSFIAHNQSLKLTGYTAIIGKASCYGGDFKITPDAGLTDPYLYVFLTHKKGRIDLIRYLSGILMRRPPLEFEDISYFRATQIEIEGSSHIQIDGDYAGTAPARIEVVPDALKLVTGN